MKHYVLRDRISGLYLNFSYGYLSPVRMALHATPYTRIEAEEMIYVGVYVQEYDDWPSVERRLDVEIVYVPELNKAQLRLPLHTAAMETTKKTVI